MVLLQRPRKETNMAKVLKCNDLDPDCSFAARGNSDEDVLKKVAEHAKTDVLDKARSAIRDEGKARTKSGFAEKKEGNHSWW
jgi:predicted small metal-binding protein